MLLNKEQFEIAVEDILKFNRISHSEDFRQTEEYLKFCYDNVNEEYCNEYMTEWRNFDYGEKFIDGCCDTFVTVVQLIDKIEPWSLTYENYLNTVSEPFGDNLYSYMALLREVSVTSQSGGKIDFFGCLYEVNQSNLSKLPLRTEVNEMYPGNMINSKRNSESWIEYNRECNHVTSSIILHDREYYVVFKNENGKVMKWEGYKEPNLKPFLDQRTLNNEVK